MASSQSISGLSLEEETHIELPAADGSGGGSGAVRAAPQKTYEHVPPRIDAERYQADIPALLSFAATPSAAGAGAAASGTIERERDRAYLKCRWLPFDRRVLRRPQV